MSKILTALRCEWLIDWAHSNLTRATPALVSIVLSAVSAAVATSSVWVGLSVLCGLLALIYTIADAGGLFDD
jgi:hypothetical protein